MQKEKKPKSPKKRRDPHGRPTKAQSQTSARCVAHRQRSSNLHAFHATLGVAHSRHSPHSSALQKWPPSDWIERDSAKTSACATRPSAPTSSRRNSSSSELQPSTHGHFGSARDTQLSARMPRLPIRSNTGLADAIPRSGSLGSGPAAFDAGNAAGVPARAARCLTDIFTRHENRPRAVTSTLGVPDCALQ